MINNPIRKRAAALFHGATPKGLPVIIADKADPRWDYDQLRTSSVFNLILAGDLEFSYRFSEAVCSGGVPVLLANKWVPPFNDSLPFPGYGVYIHEDRIQDALTILGLLSASSIAALRTQAAVACRTHFRTVGATASQVLQMAVSIRV